MTPYLTCGRQPVAPDLAEPPVKQASQEIIGYHAVEPRSPLSAGAQLIPTAR